MRPRESAPHPLFHSLVMMGGSLAVACGGAAPGSGNTGIGEPGSGGGGGGPGMGGAGGAGAGGSLQSGGAAATGGTSAVHIWPCVPARWSCDPAAGNMPACGGLNPIDMPSSCTCDATRPLTAEACPPSTLFVCRLATRYDPAVGAVVETIAFECSCASVSADSAGCKAVFDGPYVSDAYEYQVVGADGGTSSLLCGCAITYLK